ncbi:MAG: indolepyruvate ferredoxin oxidoreductase [Phycisphaerales bacterium]|nr:indolepyruvate ferredoxin oxidoreductase [Phycisphaerales bacterium]
MKTELLLGDEAIALGALHAGIGGAFAYPGTPSTEIFEYVAAAVRRGAPVAARWSANEKVAYEEALGMSYAGRRALVSMKHVGLNVAADPFVNSALTGANGGLVVVVADDPGMHSSQNEQDSRFYGEFAQIPILEPANQQEAYDFTRAAFELSEHYELPFMVRIVTRLAHSRANVRIATEDDGSPPPAQRPYPDADDWTLVPTNSRRRFRRLLELQPQLRTWSERHPLHAPRLAGQRGIIAAGIASNYVREALAGSTEDSYLRIAAYPLPVEGLRALVDHCSELLIFEDGYPFIEKRLLGTLGLPGKAVRGKLDGTLPPDGELTPDLVAAALGRPFVGTLGPLDDLTGRPPALCRGCPHADTFKALIEATGAFPNALLFSDIGCYTLGVLPPYRAVHSCVDMGASIAMAHGAAQAGAYPVLCTIGDSTFTHSGMTPLIGAIRSDADMTVFILDNAIVAMTGGQETMAAGEQLLNLLRGLGVPPEQLHLIDPLPKNHAENVTRVRSAIEHRGLSVVVAQRECIHNRRKARASEIPTAGACSVCGA